MASRAALSFATDTSDYCDMAKRSKKAAKAPTETLRAMEHAAQETMVRAMVEGYKKQMRAMNNEIAAFLNATPGVFDSLKGQ